jgi:small conductance mechanosensitive channel
VEKVTIEAIESIPSRLKSEDVTLHWEEFGSRSSNFSGNVWMEYDKDHSNYIGVRNEAIKALKKAFDKNDITRPFPIRTLDFGIKGGEHLRDELGMFETSGEKN